MYEVDFWQIIQEGWGDELFYPNVVNNQAIVIPVILDAIKTIS